jgi:hypothetical protein
LQRELTGVFQFCGYHIDQTAHDAINGGFVLAFGGLAQSVDQFLMVHSDCFLMLS